MSLSPLESLEAEFGSHVRRHGTMGFLPASQTIRLLNEIDRLRGEGVSSLVFSLEAFKLFDDGGVQIALEYSYPTPEARARHVGVLAATREMVMEGASKGYSWYEVWIEDTETRECFAVGSRTAP